MGGTDGASRRPTPDHTPRNTRGRAGDRLHLCPMRFFTARQLSSWSRRTPPKCARVAKLTAGGFPWLVAEGDGRVTGYAYAGPYHDRPAYRWALENSVYIAPDSTRRGIGRALLEALVAES